MYSVVVTDLKLMIYSYCYQKSKLIELMNIQCLMDMDLSSIEGLRELHRIACNKFYI